MIELSNGERRSIQVGDIVTVFVIGGYLKEPVTDRVIEVHKRWGTHAVPQITLASHEDGDDVTKYRMFDSSWITEIVARGPRVPSLKKDNVFDIFRRDEYTSPRRLAPKGHLFFWGNDISNLVRFVLGGLPYEIDRVLHCERANKLWQKAGCPGLKEKRHLHHDAVLIVREKPFRRWVMQNWSRLLLTVREMNEEADACAEEEARMMAEDIVNSIEWYIESDGEVVRGDMEEEMARFY